MSLSLPTLEFAATTTAPLLCATTPTGVSSTPNASR